MKKLFICCPTEGRNDADIIKSVKKIHQYAELITGKTLDVLPVTDATKTKEDNEGNARLNIVCADMMYIAKANYIAFPEKLYGLPSDFAEITRIELHAAEVSGLKLIAIPEIAMDTFFPDMKNENVCNCDRPTCDRSVPTCDRSAPTCDIPG